MTKRIFYILAAILGLVWLTMGAFSLFAPKPVPAPVPVETVQPQPVVKAIKKPVAKPVVKKARPRPAPVAPVAEALPEFRFPWE